MDVRYIPAPARHLFGFSRKELTVAMTAYLKEKGLSVNTGVTYVVGLENYDLPEGEALLTLIVDDMPDIMKSGRGNPLVATAKEVATSGRLPGQQKFEFSRKGVMEALIACSIKPFPEGPVTLWGLDESVERLTLFVDPA